MANLYRFENHLRCVGDTKRFVDHGIQLAPGGGTPIMIFRQLNALFAVHSKLDYPFSVKKRRHFKPPIYTEKSPFCLKRHPFPRGVGGATRGNAGTDVP